jgi:uncharacterized membrane protein (UPF0136 family)
MLSVVRIFFVVFGLLSIAGGLMGFLKARSAPSLIAGSVAGLLLLTSAFLMGTGQTSQALIIGFVVSLGLAGRFVPAYLKTKKPMPAGLMAVLGVIGVVLTLVALVQK